MSTRTAPAPSRARDEGSGIETRKDEGLAVLERALGRETQAVRELREALVRQRDGVAADSIETVHGSCDDIGRLLVTLDAARRYRSEILSGYLPDGEMTLEALATSLGGTLPPALEEARDTLRLEARAAAKEAAVNRVVLQRTVEAGEAFLQALFAGAGDRDPVYRAGERRDDDGSGRLLDRTA